MKERIYALGLGYTTVLGALAWNMFATHGGVRLSAQSLAGGTVFTPGSMCDGRLLRAGVVQNHMYGAGRLRGAAEIWSTAVVLQNNDGALDALRDVSFESATISASNTVTLNTDMSSSDPQECQHGLFVAEQPVCDTETLTIALRDYRARLAELPLTATKYAGTNTGSPLAGIEGTANDLKGKPKPVVLGTVSNITPNLVNTARLIYQADGMRGFVTGFTITVYDKRSALTRGADYPDQATMESTSPAAGQYRVWPAGGCFRVGSTPVGQVTCDITNPPASSADPDSLVAALTQVLTVFASPLVGNNVYQFLTANPKVGIYVNEERSYLDVCNELLASVNACLIFGARYTVAADGPSKALIAQLTSPTSLPYTPVLDPIELDESTIDPRSLQPVIPDDGAKGLPVWRVVLNYKRNYTVMSEADLAGVAAADKEFCKQEWRSVISEDASVKTQWKNAQELHVYTLLVDTTQAQAESDRLLALFKVRRATWRVPVPGSAIRMHPQFAAAGFKVTDFQPGCRVKLTLDRFSMGAGKTFIATSVVYDLDADQYELVLWG